MTNSRWVEVLIEIPVSSHLNGSSQIVASLASHPVRSTVVSWKWLFDSFATLPFPIWCIAFLMLISSLMKCSVTCSPCCLVVSISPDWRIMIMSMNRLARIRCSTRLTLWCTLHEQFELQRNHLSSPWKESQSQSLVPSMERLQSRRGGQGRGRRRGLARASSWSKLLWRLRLHVWDCVTLLQQAYLAKQERSR